MTLPRALPAALLLLSALLAGCSSGPSGNGFSVEAPEAPGGAYTFTSDVDADNYTWDLGDRLTVAYGRSVTHTYDLRDAALTVTLRTSTAGVAREYSQPLVLGSGQNAKATFLMEAERDWLVTGEPVRFSAARSFDPEGDPLRFSWSCLRTGDAQRQPPHEHPVIGQPFASPPVGSVTTGKTNRTLPAPDQTFEGDLCDALGSGTRMSTRHATIAGTFTRTGIYSLYLLASDGSHPTTSGEFKFYVTPPSERPAPTFARQLNVTLQGGMGGLQGVCSHEQNPAPQTCDEASLRFDLPLGATEMLVNISHTTTVPEPAGSAATVVAWEVRRGDAIVAAGRANPDHAALTEPAKLGAGAYTAQVTLEHGAQVQVLLTVFVRLDMDPGKVY